MERISHLLAAASLGFILIPGALAAKNKRTLQQLIDLAMKIGVEKDIPTKLAIDFGLDSSLRRKRIAIDDGKSEPNHVLSIVFKQAADRSVPVSIILQETKPSASTKNAYSFSNYHTTIAGELLAVAVGEAKEVEGKAVGAESLMQPDLHQRKFLAIEFERFLNAPNRHLKAE